MKTKLINRYTQSHLAFIHKGLLEENGIEAFVFGDHFMNTFPNMSGILNAGIELRVREEDYEKAVEILEAENSEPLICSNCGSENIEFTYGKSSFSKIIFSLFSAIAGEPFGNIRRHYFCKECGFKSGE
jgi:predicted RNA-binding Zn-ribbon protein involved in translation (DUF1610 family)